jgi:hypothetical protein
MGERNSDSVQNNKKKKTESEFRSPEQYKSKFIK